MEVGVVDEVEVEVVASLVDGRSFDKVESAGNWDLFIVLVGVAAFEVEVELQVVELELAPLFDDMFQSQSRGALDYARLFPLLLV